MEVPATMIGDYSAPLKKDLQEKTPSGEPSLDKEGNVLPYPGCKTEVSNEYNKYGNVSPIARLAKVAALGQRIPTAGEWAIDNMTIDPQRNLEIPPECYLYDEDRPWVLGKLNPEALGVPEPADPVPLSKKTLDYFDDLDAAYNAEMAEMRRRAEEEEREATKKADDQTAKASDEKTNASLKDTKKPKSRNVSVSPASRRPTTGRSSTSPSTRAERIPLTGRPKTPKSPGRGVSPQAKIVPSSGPKKVMNAKVDLEIVEKKN